MGADICKEKFQSLQRRYRRYGADDSEPDGVFQDLLFYYKDSQIPQNGDGWALYTNSMNCERVAAKLSDAALDVLNIAKGCPPDQIPKMDEYRRTFWLKPFPSNYLFCPF